MRLAMMARVATHFEVSRARAAAGPVRLAQRAVGAADNEIQLSAAECYRAGAIEKPVCPQGYRGFESHPVRSRLDGSERQRTHRRAVVNSWQPTGDPCAGRSRA